MKICKYQSINQSKEIFHWMFHGLKRMLHFLKLWAKLSTVMLIVPCLINYGAITMVSRRDPRKRYLTCISTCNHLNRGILGPDNRSMYQRCLISLGLRKLSTKSRIKQGRAINNGWNFFRTFFVLIQLLLLELNNVYCSF